jgi:hypothetical protein
VSIGLREAFASFTIAELARLVEEQFAARLDRLSDAEVEALLADTQRQEGH